MKKRLACLSLIFAMAATQILPVSAARKDDVQAQKSETQNKLSEAEARANSLEEQKGAIMGQISSSEQELVDVLSQIDILAGEITDKEAEIEKTKEDLVQAEQDRDEQYEAMKKRIQYMYENGGSDAWAQILLESDSIASMLSKVENTEKMYAYDRAELKEMKEAVQEVKDLETKLENEKSELEIAKEEQEGMKGSIQTKIEDLKAQEEAARKEQEKQQKEAEQNKNNNNNNNSNNNSNNNKPSNNNSGNTNNKPSSNKPSNGGGNSKPESQKPSSKPETEKPSTPSYNGSTGAAVVAYAKQFIGNPYVYGGNSLTNGIDCSGFTQQIYGHFGYSLPRTSGDQAFSGVGINYSQHRAGDLIVYPGHVAILTGDGGIVHASNSAPYPKGGIKYTANALYRSPIAVRRIVQ